MCYNFLLFLSGFKEFIVAYTLVFFLVFILQEFLEKQYHSSISRTDSIEGECYEIFQRVISTDSSDSSSVLSPRPQRLRTFPVKSVSNGTFPTITNVRRGCVTEEFPLPYTVYIYPYDR
jgi:hypothetical protein